VPKVAGLNLSSGSESTFYSDLLLTAIDVTCLLFYLGNTLCSQRLEPPELDMRYTNPPKNFFHMYTGVWISFSRHSPNWRLVHLFNIFTRQVRKQLAKNIERVSERRKKYDW
jgi:hypothetical protein